MYAQFVLRKERRFHYVTNEIGSHSQALRHTMASLSVGQSTSRLESLLKKFLATKNDDSCLIILFILAQQLNLSVLHSLCSIQTAASQPTENSGNILSVAVNRTR